MGYRSILKTVYKVSDFISWQRSGSLELSPNFQRRSVWPHAAKSYLMDTIVRGLPIPIIFLRERTNLETLEPVREVVDGQQRLRTVIAYLAPNTLRGFDAKRDGFVVKRIHNPDVANKAFGELTENTRKRILNYDFSVHVLPSDTEDREVLQIFARMNSTGYKLNAQELRNAEYYGVFKKLMYELAYEQLNRWRSWTVFSEMDIARMTEVEETSDLAILMLKGLHGKSQPTIARTYRENEDRFPEGTEVARRFRIVMDKIEDTLGAIVKDTVFSGRVLFNTLFTFYYDEIFGLGSGLQKMKPRPLKGNVALAMQRASNTISDGDLDEGLAKALRGATGNVDARRTRLKFLKRGYRSV